MRNLDSKYMRFPMKASDYTIRLHLDFRSQIKLFLHADMAIFCTID